MLGLFRAVKISHSSWSNETYRKSVNGLFFLVIFMNYFKSTYWFKYVRIHFPLKRVTFPLHSTYFPVFTHCSMPCLTVAQHLFITRSPKKHCNLKNCFVGLFPIAAVLLTMFPKSLLQSNYFRISPSSLTRHQGLCTSGKGKRRGRDG